MTQTHPRSEPGSPKPDAILVCDSIVRRFGGVVASNIAHLEVQAGWVTSIIGPNGAGKTTLFNIISGFQAPDGGVWFHQGRKLAGKRASDLARHGLVRTFQHARTFAKLTVLENVMMAAPRQSGERLASALLPAVWRRQEREIAERAEGLIERFGLAAVKHLPAGRLSGGQRKLLELARAVMAAPTLLLLDEPMAGVNPALREELLRHMASLRDQGMTILLIEHDMDAVARISDWVVCLAEGTIIAEGSVEEVRSNPAVIDAYLGRGRTTGSAAASAAGDAPPADVVFEVRDLVAGYLPGIDILNGCSLTAHRAEAVGIFGPNGAGKSTLLKTIVGQAKRRSGDILLEGASIAHLPAHALPSNGIGYVPQLDSVFATLTIEENLRLGLYLQPRRWAERRDAMLAQFPMLERLWRKRADDLSGGERKVVAVARALMMEPRVLLFDEPSAGLSPDRQDELFDLIHTINRTGVTVIIVEQNARQCLEICDRGYVLDRGTNAFVGRPQELLNDEKVVALYLGRMHQRSNRP